MTVRTIAFSVLTFLLFSVFGADVFSQTDSTRQSPSVETAPVKEKSWYEKISIRGYTQVRYNRLLETNPKLKCEQCDKSWGENGGIFIRRSRIVFSGDVSPRVYVYLQPDFAASASGTALNFLQMRDAYFDLSLTKDKAYRLRLGQSKIPYGFENMQSSQNRLPLDREDAINSALANERDLGAFFYWAPPKIRERFSHLTKAGLKGSGDYGVLALGTFNGQTANKPELNNSLHYVGRLTYPFQLKNGQIFEPGIQAFTGRYVIPTDQISAGLNVPNREFLDQRAAASLVVYPQPFGFQAEYNVGVGPEFNPETKTIESKKLEGGYAMIMYKFDIKKQHFIPFIRTQYYEGGKKHETDARKYLVREHEFGFEWQPFNSFELTAMYTISDRTFEDYKLPINRQQGNLLRLQVQFNY
ncbi:MAG: porin [Sphingobacteriales bacterium]|nr:MAG: porin [Sphingobacteriales bacterium]